MSSERTRGPETASLDISIRPGPVVTISGEIDIYSGPQLRDQLLDVIRRHGAGLALDLTGVTFIDCAGINVLLAARRRAQLEGGWLRVIRASPRVQRVIALTRLGPVLMPTPRHPNPSPRRRRRGRAGVPRSIARAYGTTAAAAWTTARFQDELKESRPDSGTRSRSLR
jgi:anti-sigma B factor antagonist